MQKDESKPQATPINEQCPQCGGDLLLRDKNGSSFITCSNFPKCRYTRKILTTPSSPVVDDQKPVKKCPECDGSLVRKKGPYGYFLGCTNYPRCNHMEKIRRNKRK